MVIPGDSSYRTMSVMILISIGIALFGCSEVVANECYLDQEQDRQGKLRWVQPAERVNRCACTSLRPGGVNMMRPHRHEEPQYTDNPMFTDDVDEIKIYFNCPGNKLAAIRTCLFSVDPLRPSFAGCPKDISKIISNGASTVVVEWDEPTASDDSGVLPTVVNETPDKGHNFTEGTHIVTYRATNGAGSSQTCTFKVYVLPSVSLNKLSAWQSTDWMYTARAAVDGSIDTFSHTDIRFVGVVARAGLSSNYAGNQQCGPPASDQSVDNGKVQFLCDPPLWSTFVHLDKDSTNNVTTTIFLEIAEIRLEQRNNVSRSECVTFEASVSTIQATSNSQNSTGSSTTEIPLLGRNVSQSSTYPLLRPAMDAIDGNVHTFSRTGYKDPHPWWLMDLVNEHCLGIITVSNTKENPSFTGAVARGGVSSDYTQNQQCGSTVTAAQVYNRSMVTFVCDPPVTARYVSLDIDPSRSGNDAALRIAEVTIGEHPTRCAEIQN